MYIRRLRPSEQAQRRALRARIIDAHAARAAAVDRAIPAAVQHAVANMIFDALVALDEARRVHALEHARSEVIAPVARAHDAHDGMELVRRLK
jgi:hypothetical protein